MDVAYLSEFVDGEQVFRALAGDAEVQAAQTTIDSQLKAFSADDGNTAYSYAAPNVKQIFPTLDAFMSMVTNGYAPVRIDPASAME